jgi:hypothetical protein
MEATTVPYQLLSTKPKQGRQPLKTTHKTATQHSKQLMGATQGGHVTQPPTGLLRIKGAVLALQQHLNQCCFQKVHPICTAQHTQHSTAQHDMQALPHRSRHLPAR